MRQRVDNVPFRREGFRGIGLQKCFPVFLILAIPGGFADKQILTLQPNHQSAIPFFFFFSFLLVPLQLVVGIR